MRTTSVSGIPIAFRRMVSRARRPVSTSPMAASRLANNSGAISSGAGSRATLRQRLGFEIESFCYPNGDCDERVAGAVRRAGYRHAVTTKYGVNSSDNSHYLWKRCDMQGSHARTRSGHFSEGRMLLRLTGMLASAS